MRKIGVGLFERIGGVIWSCDVYQLMAVEHDAHLGWTCVVLNTATGRKERRPWRVPVNFESAADELQSANDR